MTGDIVVTLAGSPVQLIAGSLRVTDRHGARSIAELRVDVASVATRGCPVSITFDEAPPGSPVTLFTGYVAMPETVDVDPISGRVVQALTCVDQHYLADKRQVVDGWQTSTAATIVGDIITNVLAAEGVTAGTIETGPTFDLVAFNYGTSCARALDLLAERSGKLWRINYDKTLDFRAPALNPAPFDLDLSLGYTADGFPEVQQHATRTRNRQILKGGLDVTDPQTETFVGDGETRTWVVAWPVAKVPTVEVNIAAGGWSAQTVGIRGVDTGVDFYWNKGDNVVSQDDSETALTSADKVRITYQGLFPLLVQIDDEADQINRQAKEGGGTGIVEAVTVAADLETRDDAIHAASLLLDKFARDSTAITAAGDLDGLVAGQSITVDLLPWGIDSEQGVVSEVAYVDHTGADLIVEVVITIGPEADPVKAWAHALEGADLLTIRENVSPTETLSVLTTYTEGVTVDETVLATVNACTVVDNPGPLVGSFSAC